MAWMLQLGEAADTAKKIGVDSTIILIVLLFIVTTFTLVVRWLMKSNDTKDTEYRKLAAAQNEIISKAIQVMTSSEGAIRALSESLKDIASSTKGAIEELRREITKK